MAVFKKNIWMLYFLIVSITLILFILLGYNKWDANREDFVDKQHLQVELFSTSVNSLLTSQEALLEVVGHQLVQQADFTRTAALQIRPILDQLLNTHPAIAAFGLANKEGNFIAVSSNLSLSTLPGLMERPHTRDSFIETLNSDKMILGRTYFHESLDSLIIPIRKAISLPGKGVQAVMTAGLQLNSTLVFNDNTHYNDYNELLLIRADHFRQFESSSINSVDRYNETVNANMYKTITAKVAEHYDISVEEIKLSNHSYSIAISDPQINAIVTAKYLRDYKLWVVGQTDLTYVDELFAKEFLSYLLVFILLHIGFYSLVNSISKSEQKAKEQLVYQASHDPLTRLPNRQFMRGDIHNWLSNKTKPFSLLFIDIDNFKSVNDTHGHDFGDKVLKQISKRLIKIHTSECLIVRESSDEFILLTPRSNEQDIKALAQRIIDDLAVPYEVNDSQFLLGCSIGISMFPEHGNDLDSLLRAADISMYKAKKQQNSFSIFTSEMQETHLYKMKVEQRLRLAVENKNLFMVFQPQVNADGSTYGVEALVRWIDEELGFIPPDVFIPIAENTGLMNRLGTFIIESSIQQIARLHQSEQIKFGLSINISVRQFMNKRFSEHLMSTLEKYQFNPDLLTLEITENLFIEDLSHVKPICEDLHKKGIRISLDDFGTGYSSLSMLKALPINELKIDKSFIENIHCDQQSLTMVQNIIAIGKNFGMIVLAEGVESNQHFDVLKECKCDLMQGYYFSRPISSEELAIHLNQQVNENAEFSI